MAAIRCLLLRLIVVLSFITSIETAKYLLFGMNDGSAGLNARCVGEALAAKGHNVTIVGSERFINLFNLGKEKKYNLIPVPGIFSPILYDDIMDTLATAALQGNIGDVFWDLRDKIIPDMNNFLKKFLSHSDIIDQLQNENFDFALFDSLYIGFAHVLNAIEVPYVIMDLMIANPYIAWLMRADRKPSYYPGDLLEMDQHMNFIQRFQSTLANIKGFLTQLIFFWMAEPIRPEFNYNFHMDKSTSELLNKAEMWFIRTHSSLDFPRPLPPHVIPIGGQMARPPRPLELVLDAFVRRSGDHGTIVFSFGSYMKSMKKDQAEIFTAAFSRLKQHVVMKYGDGQMLSLPNNTMVLNWIPQNDLLGHSNTKLFISHCGCNGAFEALYHAVPIICIPLFHDQFGMAQRIVSRGIGIRLDIVSLTSDKLHEAIVKVLGNQSFQTNIDRLSAIYRDDPQTPSERVVYWMEFLVRHGGAKHLRSSAHDLNFLQYHLVDVIAVLTVISILTLLVLLTLSLYICKTLGNYVNVSQWFANRSKVDKSKPE